MYLDKLLVLLSVGVASVPAQRGVHGGLSGSDSHLPLNGGVQERVRGGGHGDRQAVRGDWCAGPSALGISPPQGRPH